MAREDVDRKGEGSLFGRTPGVVTVMPGVDLTQPLFELDDLIAGITDDNKHEEIELAAFSKGNVTDSSRTDGDEDVNFDVPNEAQQEASFIEILHYFYNSRSENTKARGFDIFRYVLIWFCSEIPALGNRRPVDMFNTPVGRNEVVLTVRCMFGGAYM